MRAVEIINTMIPSLTTKDDAYKALTWMEALRCDYLPVVEDRQLLGFVSEGVVRKANNVDQKMGQFDVVGKNCTVSLNCYLPAILKVANQHNMSVVAVLNDEGKYEGMIKKQEAMAAYVQTVTVKTPGETLTLSLDVIDYSLAEVARLIEENDAKVLSTLVMEDEMDSNRIKLGLKINQLDLTRIIATLERFNYKVVGKYRGAHRSQFEENNDRIDMLMRYLDV